MPRIRFTANPKLPRDWADKPYRKDYEAEVSADEAERWLRRGVAVVVPDRPVVKAKPPIAAAPKEPAAPVVTAPQAPATAAVPVAPAATAPVAAAAKDTPAKSPTVFDLTPKP